MNKYKLSFWVLSALLLQDFTKDWFHFFQDKADVTGLLFCEYSSNTVVK